MAAVVAAVAAAALAVEETRWHSRVRAVMVEVACGIGSYGSSGSRNSRNGKGSNMPALQEATLAGSNSMMAPGQCGFWRQ